MVTIYDWAFTQRYIKDSFEVSPYYESLSDDTKWMLGSDAVKVYRCIMFLLNLWFTFRMMAFSTHGGESSFRFLTNWGVHFTNFALLFSSYAAQE